MCLKTVPPSPTLDEMFIHLKGTLVNKMNYAPISGVVLENLSLWKTGGKD